MGGKFFSWLMSNNSFSRFMCLDVAGNAIICSDFYHVMFWQWLAVDKELKKLVVETTANQVNEEFCNASTYKSFRN